MFAELVLQLNTTRSPNHPSSNTLWNNSFYENTKHCREVCGKLMHTFLNSNVKSMERTRVNGLLSHPSFTDHFSTGKGEKWGHPLWDPHVGVHRLSPPNHETSQTPGLLKYILSSRTLLCFFFQLHHYGPSLPEAGRGWLHVPMSALMLGCYFLYKAFLVTFRSALTFRPPIKRHVSSILVPQPNFISYLCFYP